MSLTWRKFQYWLGGFIGPPRMDLPLLIALLLLSGIGIVLLYSASGGSQDMVLKQAIRVVIGFAAMWVISRLKPSALMQATPWLYLLGLIFLALIPVFGDGRSANNWLRLGPVVFQPAEILKLALPMMVAWHLHTRPLPPGWRDIGICVGLIALPTLMVIVQPDLGSGLLVGSAGAFVLFLAGLGWARIALFGVLGLASVPVVWPLLHDYQRERILNLFDPSRNPQASGWQIEQSRIAVGSGGWEGKGYGNGTQSQLDFLPERQTDFVFAVLSEEGGFIAVTALLALYLFIVLRALHLAAEAHDTYSRLLGGGVALTFFVYVFVNAAMISGLLPVVGIPMPLLSYGGSSAVSLLASFGVLMGIAAQRDRRKHWR